MIKTPEEREKEILEIEIKLAKAEIERKTLLPHIYSFKHYSWSQKFFDSTNKENFLLAANQVSKALFEEELVPTTSGLKKMRDIAVGDMVFSKGGTPTRVVDIPFVGTEQAYQITFNDGAQVVCGENHEWICMGPRQRFRKNYRSGGSKELLPNSEYRQWVVRTTKEIIAHGKYSPKANPPAAYSIPICGPVEFSEKELFDPYYVGVYLGNGSEHSISINPEDGEVAEHCLKYGNRYNVARRNDLVVGVLHPTRVKLLGLGVMKLSHQKEIPPGYLVGSVEQRKALLAGLMDTDGTCSKRGQNYSYSTTSEKLAEQVSSLVASLGGIAQIKRRKAGYRKEGEYVRCRDVFVVHIWTEFNPFRSKRKAARWKPNTRYKHERVMTKIEPVGTLRVKCITVAADDGSFLCTDKFVVTHNSSCQIRKCIHWATEKSLWPKLWPHLVPNQFWYLYPTKDTATSEFHTKWKQFLPTGHMKGHPVFGWQEELDKKQIKAIHFNSGVSIFFKTYAQNVADLQSSTCFAMFTDEELPIELLGELTARLNATDGYFHMVFTATLGQDYWRRTMEPKVGEKVEHPHALKLQISLYDCLTYTDGSKSHWSVDRIKRIEAKCPTPTDVQIRVYGKFAKPGGRRFESYDEDKNRSPNHPLPDTWHIYSGVDIGSGGVTGHPAAIVFLAVDPFFRRGRIFRAWRGDHLPTTSGDILVKYIELREKLKVVLQCYDYASAEFRMLAEGAGESFEPADKKHETGEKILNTLFKHNMLSIQSHDLELDKLSGELMTVQKDAGPREAGDDLCDALRYACSKVPWDFSILDGMPVVAAKVKAESMIERLRPNERPKEADNEDVDAELDEWQRLFDA